MTRTVKISSRIALTAAVFASLAPAALAGGETKNETPFTGAVARSTGLGEPKNERPFTRPVATPRIVLAIAERHRTLRQLHDGADRLPS